MDQMHARVVADEHRAHGPSFANGSSPQTAKLAQAELPTIDVKDDGHPKQIGTKEKYLASVSPTFQTPAP